MLAVNYSTLRNNFKEHCDRIVDNNETVVVTRKNEKNIVILSLEKYNSMQKAIRNAEYLEKIDMSAEQIKEGKFVVKTIEELEEMAR